MIHWIWLLLIVPAAVTIGLLAGCLLAASKVGDYENKSFLAEMERIKLANALRKKCLEVDKLKREVKRLKK